MHNERCIAKTHIYVHSVVAIRRKQFTRLFWQPDFFISPTPGGVVKKREIRIFTFTFPYLPLFLYLKFMDIYLVWLIFKVGWYFKNIIDFLTLFHISPGVGEIDKNKGPVSQKAWFDFWTCALLSPMTAITLVRMNFRGLLVGVPVDNVAREKFDLYYSATLMTILRIKFEFHHVFQPYLPALTPSNVYQGTSIDDWVAHIPCNISEDDKR